MTEIFNIFISLLILLAISSFPFSLNFYKNELYLKKNYFFDTLSLNLLLNISVLFLISFIDINYSIFFVFLLFFSIITNLVYFFKIKSYFKLYNNKNFFFFILLNLIIFFYIARDPSLSWERSPPAATAENPSSALVHPPWETFFGYPIRSQETSSTASLQGSWPCIDRAWQSPSARWNPRWRWLAGAAGRKKQ